VEGRVHDDLLRLRESLGIVTLPVFLRHIGNYGNIMDREE
jgi:hypothetical protein